MISDNQNPTKFPDPWVNAEKYPLEQVTYAHGAFRLPPTEIEFRSETLLLLSEKEGGVTAFMDWLRPKNWELIDLSETGNLEDATGEQLIIDRRTLDSTRNIRLESGQAVRKLVRYLESGWDKKLVCASHDVMTLNEDHIFSSLQSRAHICRPPSLGKKEIEEWLDLLGENSIRQIIEAEVSAENSELINTILELTGGHPGLTRNLFSLVDGALPQAVGQNKIETVDHLIELFEDMADYLQDNPPNYAIHWQAQLKAMIRDPEYRGLINYYVEGAQKPASRASRKEVMLYLTGWLKTSEDQVVIRSPLHQTYASQVLGGEV